MQPNWVTMRSRSTAEGTVEPHAPGDHDLHTAPRPYRVGLYMQTRANDESFASYLAEISPCTWSAYKDLYDPGEGLRRQFTRRECHPAHQRTGWDSHGVTDEEGYLRFNSNHALWSWAARHAAWTLNRYQASRGVTSFELTQGKSYERVTTGSIWLSSVCLPEASLQVKATPSGGWQSYWARPRAKMLESWEKGRMCC